MVSRTKTMDKADGGLSRRASDWFERCWGPYRERIDRYWDPVQSQIDRLMGPLEDASADESPDRTDDSEDDEYEVYEESRFESFERVLAFMGLIITWETPRRSWSFVAALNVFYWTFSMAEFRGMEAACSAVIIYLLMRNSLFDLETDTTAAELKMMLYYQVKKITEKLKLMAVTTVQLLHEQTGECCTALFTAAILSFMITYWLGDFLSNYIFFMSVYFTPFLILHISEERLFSLRDNLDDDELMDLRMPSHEDGSTDGLELSELELSAGESDEVDGDSKTIATVRGPIDHDSSSSSDEDADLGLEPGKMDVDDNEDEEDYDFEIIDAKELANLKNV